MIRLHFLLAQRSISKVLQLPCLSLTYRYAAADEYQSVKNPWSSRRICLGAEITTAPLACSAISCGPFCASQSCVQQRWSGYKVPENGF